MTTILIEEDEQRTQQLLQTTLTLKGYTVIESVNDEETADLAAKRIPDLVLLNTHIPLRLGMVSTLKTNGDTANIPIWALTANYLPGDRDKLLKAGCEEYLLKPIGTNQMLEFLRKIDEKFLSTEYEHLTYTSVFMEEEEPQAKAAVRK